MHGRLRSILVVMLFPLLMAACAGSAGAQIGYLLEQDYQRMTNPQLTAYEQELSDVIADSAVESGSSSGISLGVGFGSWGDHSGVGVGLEKWLGGGSGDRGKTTVELLDRREAVRNEMRSRGLLPVTSEVPR